MTGPRWLMKIDLRGFRLSGSCLRLRQTASSTHSPHQCVVTGSHCTMATRSAPPLVS